MKTRTCFVVLFFCTIAYCCSSLCFGEEAISPEKILSTARQATNETTFSATMINTGHKPSKEQLYVKANADGTKWMRMESEDTALGILLIINNDTGQYMVIDGVAVKEAPRETPSPSAVSKDAPKCTYELIEKNVNGIDSYIITEHNESNGNKSVYRIGRDNMFLFSTMKYDRTGKLISGREYKNVKIGDLDDKLFELPAGVEIKYPETLDEEITAIQTVDPINNSELSVTQNNTTSPRVLKNVLYLLIGCCFVLLVIIVAMRVKPKKSL